MLVTKIDGGGGAILDRLIQAYGFKQKTQYADHVGLSSSNLAMRYKRDAFPADLVVQCLLDTDAELTWLITGEGNPPESAKEVISERASESENHANQINVQRYKLTNGELSFVDSLSIDGRFFEDRAKPESDLIAVMQGGQQFIVDKTFNSIVDGKWLMNIEGVVSIRNLVRVPVGKVRVTGEDSDFECSLTDVTPIGAVIMICD